MIICVSQGVIFLNIESYGGGVKLWNTMDKENDFITPDSEDNVGSTNMDVTGSSSMQDGMLEVVAVNGVVHLGQLQVCMDGWIVSVAKSIFWCAKLSTCRLVLYHASRLGCRKRSRSVNAER